MVVVPLCSDSEIAHVNAPKLLARLAVGDRLPSRLMADGQPEWLYVWFLPRPLGMLEASGMALAIWEDVLPDVTDEELAAAAERVASLM